VVSLHIPVVRLFAHSRPLLLYVASLGRCKYVFPLQCRVLERSRIAHNIFIDIIVGIGYNGKDKNGKMRWDASSNVRPIALEMAMNLKECTENWNLSADRWLRNYIYLRVPKSMASFNTYITYVASAVWHGFYPGYYVAFVGSALATELYREVFRKIRPHFLVTGKDGKPTESLLYKIFAIPMCSYILASLFVPFVQLNFGIAWATYANTYYSLYVILGVSYVLLKFVIPAPKKAGSTPSSTPNGEKKSTDKPKKTD
jgi:lysophospholipid acyltransferase